MTPADFQRLLAADPFEPFVLTLTGGWEYTVDRPELAGVTAHGSAEVRRPDGSGGILSLDHVVSIEFVFPTVTLSDAR